MNAFYPIPEVLVAGALLLTVGRLGFNRGAEFATEQFLIGAVDVLSGFAPYVPTVWFLSQFCAGGSVLNLLYTAAVLAAAAVLFRIVAGTCYLGGALNMLNASSPRAMTEKRMRKLTKKRTVLASLRRPNLNRMNEADVGKGNIAYILFTVVLVLINLVIGVVSVVCTVVFLSSAARLVIGTVVLVLQTVTALISGKLMFSRGIKALKRLSVG